MASNLWGVAAPSILIALLTIGTNTFTDAIARVSLGIERREELTLLSPDLGLVAS